MEEKHELYTLVSDCESIDEVCQLFEDVPSKCNELLDLILEKLFAGILWIPMSLAELFDSVNVGKAP